MAYTSITTVIGLLAGFVSENLCGMTQRKSQRGGGEEEGLNR